MRNLLLSVYVCLRAVLKERRDLSLENLGIASATGSPETVADETQDGCRIKPSAYRAATVSQSNVVFWTHALTKGYTQPRNFMITLGRLPAATKS